MIFLGVVEPSLDKVGEERRDGWDAKKILSLSELYNPHIIL